MQNHTFAAQHVAEVLKNWYEKNARDFPWRKHPEPYHIFIAEYMLQQTQTSRVSRYFMKFINVFPDITVLAQASIERILKVTEGMGYYRRFISLHRAARMIYEEFGGEIPKTPEQLKKLPGIGPYSSCSIASIAFDYPCIAVDTNVRRVLMRLNAIENEREWKTFRATLYASEKIIFQNCKPSVFSQALMDFASLVCLNKPRCDICVLREYCFAFALNKQNQIPVRNAGKKKKVRNFYYFFLYDPVENTFSIVQRNNKHDIWFGMWDFPLAEVAGDNSISSPYALLLRLRIQDISENDMIFVDEITHTLTHQRIVAKFYACPVKAEKHKHLPFVFVTYEDFEKFYPVHNLLKKFFVRNQAFVQKLL